MTRRFQFSLKWLFLAMLLVSAPLSCLMHKRDMQAAGQVVPKVLAKGGRISKTNSARVVTGLSFARTRANAGNSASLNDSDLRIVARFEILEELDLERQPITDMSIPYLCRLRTLRFLNLAGTKISETGVAKLRATLPECRVMQ
ncbi:MAG TPA: hypothetical protein VHC22_23420 [Pirellulales bacterium]|nr:hypothetical protein [Pirellulales bacterium]